MCVHIIGWVYQIVFPLFCWFVRDLTIDPVVDPNPKIGYPELWHTLSIMMTSLLEPMANERATTETVKSRENILEALYAKNGCICNRMFEGKTWCCHRASCYHVKCVKHGIVCHLDHRTMPDNIARFLIRHGLKKRIDTNELRST